MRRSIINCGLSLFFIAMTLTSALAGINGLIGQWTFNEGSGVEVSDVSGNGKKGTLVNGPAWSAGKMGGALSFNGNGQYVKSASVPPTGDMTVCAWVNPKSFPVNSSTRGAAILTWARGYHKDGDRSLVVNPDGGITFYVSNKDGNFYAGEHIFGGGGVKIPLNQWSFLCGSISQSTGNTVWVNGARAGTNPGGTVGVNSYPSSESTLYIGAGNTIYPFDLNGTIDDVRIFNRALSAQDITALYTNKIPPGIYDGKPRGNLPVGTTSSVLSVNTDTNATCKYATSLNTPYDDMPNTFETTGAVTHSAAISGLVPATSYSFYVRCKDTVGNQNNEDYVVSFGMAGNKYVKPDGTKDFKTIAECAANAQLGDTCLIYSGTYNETLAPKNSGTYDSPITFKAMPGEAVLLDNINLDGAKNIWIEGLKSKALSQYGIQWNFDNHYPVGLFANGDFWVTGPVKIIGMTPEWNGAHNGWEVNPLPGFTQPYDAGQSGSTWDSRPIFNPSSIPALPYIAQPGSSIIKGLSVEQDPAKKPFCHTIPTYNTCLMTVAVLTVVATAPPDNGKAVFRPPYIGTEKPYYSINDLNTSSLPSLVPVESTPSLKDMFEKMRRVQFEHMMGQANEIQPYLNLPSYGPFIAKNNNEAALRLMLNDSLDDKMPLLIAYVQGGIDRYHIAQKGQGWNTGGAVWGGEKISIAFAGVLLNNADMKEYVNWGTQRKVIDLADASLVLKTKNNVPLWGGYAYGQNQWREGDYFLYWQGQTSGDAGNNLGQVSSDPYGLIESSGTVSRADGYQVYYTSGGPWKGSALAARLIPQIKEDWNNPDFFNYVDRWQEIGQWTAPDPCAPPVGVCQGGTNPGLKCTSQTESTDPNTGWTIHGNSVCTGGGICNYAVVFSTEYGRSYGDVKNTDGTHRCILDPNLVQSPPPTMENFTCQPGKTCGRYPKRHGAFKAVSGYAGSSFVDAMWSRYRQSSLKQAGDGDVSNDGKVTMYDAALVLRFTLGSNLSDDQKKAADINNDGKIDGADVVAIARKGLGL